MDLLQSLIDTYLAARDEWRGERQVAGGQVWRASEIGYCLRRQYLRAIGTPPSRLPDERTLRAFALGEQVGWWVRRVFDQLGLLIAAEVPLVAPELRCGGHLDLLVGGRVQPLPAGAPEWVAVARDHVVAQYGRELPVLGVEVKSISTFAFYAAKKRQEPVAHAHQLLQAATYAVLAERSGLQASGWIVLSVSKDDLMMAETPVTQEHRDAVIERLSLLNRAWDSGDPPECTCAGWEARYCPYSAAGGCCRIPHGEEATP